MLRVQPADVLQPDVDVIRVYHLRRYLRLMLRQGRYAADAADTVRESALAQGFNVFATKPVIKPMQTCARLCGWSRTPSAACCSAQDRCQLEAAQSFAASLTPHSTGDAAVRQRHLREGVRTSALGVEWQGE